MASEVRSSSSSSSPSDLLTEFDRLHTMYVYLKGTFDAGTCPFSQADIVELQERLQRIVNAALSADVGMQEHVGQMLDCQEGLQAFQRSVAERLGADVQRVDVALIPIEEQDILERFYNLLPVVAGIAYETGLLQREDLGDTGTDAEPYVFLGLPSLALLQVIRESREMGVSNGFVLLNNKCITERNCPEDFRGFFDGLQKIKAELAPFWKDERAKTYLAILLLGNPKSDGIKKELGSQLPSETCAKLGRVAGLAQAIATEISQRKRFQQEMGPDALMTCLAFVGETTPR